MRAKSPPPNDEVEKDLASATAAGCLALAVGQPVQAAFAAVAASLVGLGLVMVKSRATRRMERWFNAYCSGTAADPELVLAQLQARADDPLLQDVVFESLRAIEDAISEVVLLPLAKLAKEYGVEGKSVDGFFRGTRRLLCDLTEDEYRSLSSLLGRVGAIEDVPLPTIELRARDSEVVYLRPFSHEDAAKRQAVHEGVTLGQHSHVVRLFALLKTHGIGADAKSGEYGKSTGPHVTSIEQAVVRRLVDLMA